MVFARIHFDEQTKSIPAASDGGNGLTKLGQKIDTSLVKSLL